MTREEEIAKEALEYANEELIAAPYDAFMTGAQWADANPNKDNMATAYKVGEAATIDKTCEWLQENCAIIWESPCNPNKVVEQFRKAMKGE